MIGRSRQVRFLTCLNSHFQSIRMYNMNPHPPISSKLPFNLFESNDIELTDLYKTLKSDIYSKRIDVKDVTQDVFANNEVSFRHLKAFGFDYDYTLAPYSDELHKTIYKIAVDNLINVYGYPKEIEKYNFENFPIRGLHFDTLNGYLMKIDSCSRVQLGTVYRGYDKVNDQEVINQYGGTLVSVDLMNTNSNRARIFQQMDLFAMAFLSLLTNVIDYFVQKNILFDPWYIFYDVENATQLAHKTGQIHKAITDDIEKYLPEQPHLEQYMNRLYNKGKKLFLITNSSYGFLDKGMTHLFNKDWRDLFEVVIVNARKPKFFTDVDRAFRPFRNINMQNGTYLWDHVKEFQRHGVYGEGNIKLFNEFTGYEGNQVIYFGDHVYSDLMDPVLRIGWRTGAIIPELGEEIKICNSNKYVRDIEWLITLEHLITVLQIKTGSNTRVGTLGMWRDERKVLRANLKDMFNPFFGSIFRTHQNPTSFSQRVTRYADIYTSSVSNLMHYPDNFHFLPGRSFLPHERF